MNYRPLRVGNLIREELGHLITRELEFPGALVTITEIEVDKKMDFAKVLVSVLPEKEEQTSLDTLVKAQGTLQHLLNRKLNIKPMPRIAFYLDHGLKNAATVEKALLEE